MLVLIPTMVRGETMGSYGVSGYVFDDLNANGRYDQGEPGVPNVMIYADSTQGVYQTSTDAYGHWQINNLPLGAHSIEINNAGAAGSRPTTVEKFVVSGPTSAIQFGMQAGGYGVDGYVTDHGRPAAGVKVYVDLPNRQSVVTDSNGYYRFQDVGYDASPVVPGVSGGHTIYVEGSNNPQVVNPQSPMPGIRKDFTVTTDQGGSSCGPIFARDPNNPSNCAYFNNRCALPTGWQEVGSCSQSSPPGTGGQCVQGSRVPNSGTPQCSTSNQRCMVYSYYNSNCSTYAGQLEECQTVAGSCGAAQYTYSAGNDYSYLQGQTQDFQQPAQQEAVYWTNDNLYNSNFTNDGVTYQY